MRADRFFLVLASIALRGGPALAQDNGDCTFKWSVERETAAFAAFDLPDVAAGSALPGVGNAARLKLAPQSEAHFEIAPTHAAKHDPAYAGVFPLPTLADAGSYQVTLSDDGWIDVLQNGKIVKQSGFSGSHTCKAVHKSVRFTLEPGPASIEISDAPSDTLKLEVVPVAK